MSPPAEPQQAVQQQALALLTELRLVAAEAPAELQSTWAEHLDRLEELAQFLASGGISARTPRLSPPASHAQWTQFGRLLRDKRNAAGLSRVQLARRAKLSDATVKFTETARHPPSRATLIRLLGVSELKLRWAEVPGQPESPSAETSDLPLRAESTELPAQLNCLLTPSADSLPLIADLARFLNGAGGYVEQTHAYLDHYSAADYLALCQSSLAASTLRSRMPLGELAKRIVAISNRAPLRVIALGAGD
ncbi:MAG TPA: helix-turn-helix transcriptional regulator, partial [Pseudomonadota bacterium]|nr:helix-turn-helix transcriptional regulator [Pseudomonadota bacterium]